MLRRWVELLKRRRAYAAVGAAGFAIGAGVVATAAVLAFGGGDGDRDCEPTCAQAAAESRTERSATHTVSATPVGSATPTLGGPAVSAAPPGQAVMPGSQPPGAPAAIDGAAPAPGTAPGAGAPPPPGGSGAGSGGGANPAPGSGAPATPAPGAPQPAPAPTATPPLAVSAGPGSGCTTNCGEPRLFCDAWNGGFCDDYRDVFCPAHCRFPSGGRDTSFDAFSATGPQYSTSGFSDGGLRSFGNDQEHFHSVIEDSNFGVGLFRIHRPFDFSGREGHIHFDVDLKTSARRYVRLMLSPQLTKTVVDDRDFVGRPEEALDIWFVDGTIGGIVWDGGNEIGGFDKGLNRYRGTDNVRDHVDVYVSRSSVRVLINGQQFVSAGLPDLGFDRAYVYLSQVSYNPCKDGECESKMQIFHWDNVAFDGPRLGANSLTPSGSRDVLFNAYSAASCSVNGVAADPVGEPTEYTWVSWVARLPDDGAPVNSGSIACQYTYIDQGSDQPRGLEIVRS